MAAKLSGKSFYRRQWSKIAHGLSQRAGNVYCTYCAAEFDFDKAGKTLALRLFDRDNYSWVATWHDTEVPVRHWYLWRSGKQSLKAGWLCTKCETEFDDDSPGITLVRTPRSRWPPMLVEHVADDWQRCAAGIPTTTEQQELLGEIQRLEALKRKEAESHRTTMEQRRLQIENELAQLYKQDFACGVLPVRPSDARAKIPNGEVLCWESRSWKMKQRSRQGTSYWESESGRDDRCYRPRPAVRRWCTTLGKAA